MPPFKNGLLKRKVDSNDSNNSIGQAPDKESLSGSEDEKLMMGEIDGEGDQTDSEQEDAKGADSEAEQDEVLFGDNEDSILGDVEETDTLSDQSSDLPDSESDGEAVETDDAEDNKEDNHSSDNNENSDAESGIGQTHSSSSESDKTHVKNKVKEKHLKSNMDKDKHSKGSIDRLAESIERTSVGTRPVAQLDEYESGDTSDEEERRNTVGDVPMWWYNEYPHVGYDLDGRRIIKPPQRDQIDEFLKKCEDPDFWRTVRDPTTGQDVVLSAGDLQLLRRLREGRVPDPQHNEYEPWVEWFSREVLATPLRAFPDHKRSFLPSESERLHVARLVHALKMGWAKTRKQIAAERRARRDKKFYDLWGSRDADEERAPRGVHRPIPAPRRPPPAHAESYNPPPEYLLDAKEMKEWNELAETPWKRKYTFLPSKHASLRAVPAYERFTRERFLRCLDLYLAPRAIKMRLTIAAEDLVPRLPAPRELRPFPTAEALCLRGHEGAVRSVDFEPSGQYAASGGDDGTVRVWETGSGRCLRTVRVADEPVARVAWIPVPGLSLVAVATGARLLLLNPGEGVGAHRVAAATDLLLQEPPPQHDVVMDARTAACVEWQRVGAAEWARGVRVGVAHFRPVAHVAWHARGDYVCATLRDAASRAVVVHQLSRRRSQLPLARARGLVQCALFHPRRPLLVVATQRAVRLYDLVRQQLVRKLRTGAQWVSHVAVHPSGDHLLVASYDRKCVWFDLELSAEPYRTLRLHAGAVRAVAFHARYPLFASAGDDANVVVSHATVYNDLLQNPLLVPLKQLRAPAPRDGLRVLDLRFHPTQPWLVAACADGTLRLYA